MIDRPQTAGGRFATPRSAIDHRQDWLDDEGSGLGLQIFDDHYRFAISLHDMGRSKLGFVVGDAWLLTLGKTRPALFDEFIEADRGETLKEKCHQRP